MVYTMIKKAIRNKQTGKIIWLPESAYEVGDGIVVPLQHYHKDVYEPVNRKPKENKA